MRDAVFGNVGTTVVFRVGPFDAELLETIFMPKFTKEDIVSLDRNQIYLSLMIDGVGSPPFSAVTIPPIEAPPVSYREQIITASREQFAAPRARIEQAIIDELNESLAAEAPPDARMKHPERRAPASATPRSSPTSLPPSTAGSPPRRSVEPVPDKVRAPERATERPSLRQQFEWRGEERGRQPAREARREAVASPRLPTPPQKSAADLKDILRAMTEKVAAERHEVQTKNQQSLQGALKDSLAKGSAAPAPEKRPFEIPEAELRKVLKGET